jgi:hypothetical protein
LFDELAGNGDEWTELIALTIDVSSLADAPPRGQASVEGPFDRS